MNDTELLTQEIAEPEWAINGIIPEGLTLLAGQPKAGKSWIALDAAMAVASGASFLGMEANIGDVLYLALEDSPYRLKARVSAWTSKHESKPTGNIEFSIDWPSVKEGGLDQMAEWLGDFPSLRMIVIDTLAIFQPVSGRYNQAYPDLTRLAKIGREHHTAIVAVHHAYRGLRAGSKKPVIESIQGSIGVSAAADAILVLVKDPDTETGTLHVTGKDVDGSQIPLEWQKGGGWVRAGSGNANATEKTTALRARVLEFVRDHPGTDARDIAAGVERTYESVRQLLWQMRDSNMLARENGRYRIAPFMVVAEVA